VRVFRPFGLSSTTYVDGLGPEFGAHDGFELGHRRGISSAPFSMSQSTSSKISLTTRADGFESARPSNCAAFCSVWFFTPASSPEAGFLVPQLREGR
jgi:hypothetical protein